MTRLVAPNCTKSEEEEKTNELPEEVEGEWLWDGKRHQEQADIRATESPAAARGWDRQGRAGLRGEGRETQMENRQGKPFKDARLNMGFSAKEQQGTRMAWPGAKR